MGTDLGVFIGLTVILLGGAAILAGRAIADNWKPYPQVLAAAFGLMLANRFLVFALFDGELLNPVGVVIDFLVLAALGLLAWRVTLVHKLCRQYPWRWERASLLSARRRPEAGA
jgi:branched-chain amino acid transport system ATP-binding protein